MRLIKPNYSLIQQEAGLEGIYKQIENAGRTCYKSSPKYRYWTKDRKRCLNEDTEDFKIEYSKELFPIKQNISAKNFTERMIKSGHGAMLEHGTVYLKGRYGDLIGNYEHNKYSKVFLGTLSIIKDNTDYYITTNYRVLVENNWLDDLQYLCAPTENHEKRISVKFICDRGISHEFVRHRVFSFAQESTRYCNYSKDQFNEEITYIIPPWLGIEEGVYDCFEDSSDIEDFYAHISTPAQVPLIQYNGIKHTGICRWLKVLATAACEYIELIEAGGTPQQARSVLPNSLKTELIMTGFAKDWEHFFSLRDAVAAHPQARELAQPLHKEFKQLSYV